MSKYFIQDPQYMWNAYASNQSKEQGSALVDFTFDIQKRDQTMKNYGRYSQKEYVILGNYQPLYELDPSLMGVQFNNNSYLGITNLNFAQPNASANTALFLLKFLY